MTLQDGDTGPMSEEKAAEKIQASFRGYKTRKSLKNNGALPEKTEENAKAGENAARPKSVPVTEDPELVDIDLTDKELEKAAYKIQNSYRNFTKKKQVPEKVLQNNSEENEKVNENSENVKQDDPLEDIDLNDPDVEKAALKIQSTFRGYKTRKEITPLQNGDKGEDEE